MPKPRGKRDKQLRPVLHIFCEGEKTEPNYLNGYLNKFHPGNRRLKVIKVERTRKNTPKQLVEEAVAMKKDRTTPPSDTFWVVYDRESTTKYPDSLHHNAYQKAQSNTIEIAMTNVCFEVWILLHFTDVTASYSSCNDLLSNSQLKAKLLERGIRRYGKADLNVFAVMSEDDIDNARERAEKMNKTTLAASPAKNSNPYQLNPYTDMHKLLDAIDKFVENSSA